MRHRSRRAALSRFGVSFLTFMLASLVLVPTASASRSCHYLDFVKNSSNQQNSSIKYRYQDGEGRCSLSHSYRAGSGTTKNPCEKGKGWLPNGWYDVRHYNEYAGTQIWGRVWHLQNKTCSDGTERNALFIHTEETTTNGQSCSSANDDPKCWDGYPSGEATNDYKSNGCIKVRRSSPEHSRTAHMGDLHDDWQLLGISHGTWSEDRLRVQ